jgi:3-hydroxymyristoyl/3-hydroxydecanoyl-(acyl carrier protein) dehydratase
LKPSSADPAWSSAEHRFDADHPTAAGHFPGNPIIPGALLLDQALRAIGADVPLEIQVVKFLSPVRPGDSVAIRWQPQDGGAVTFECRVRDALALSGAARPLR